MGFSVFLVRFFGFCTEKLRFLRFVGRCGFRFFGFLASSFLAKMLGSIQVKLQCGILDFSLRFTVGCVRLSVSVDERKKRTRSERSTGAAKTGMSEKRREGRRGEPVASS